MSWDMGYFMALNTIRLTELKSRLAKAAAKNRKSRSP
jgi:hypothetical protein